MRSPQAEAVLEAQDESLEAIVAELDERVGRGRYVVVMTADHGQSPIPEELGGLRIDRYQLHDDLNEAFDDAVEAVHPSDLFLDLERPEISVEEMARFIGGYRYRDGLPEDVDEDDVAPELLDRRVFAAALPGEWLAALSPAEIEALGPGSHPEGDLMSPPDLETFPAS
ncbi:MAG: alkaline phosphatase family protein, partial [Actinomycetota bacterium]|nr:alkaline phosphatase family protein [Actinomycetota bacterium]